MKILAQISRLFLWTVLIATLMLFASACDKEFFSPGDTTDQPAEDEADQGDGTSDPWENDDTYPGIRIFDPEPGALSVSRTITVDGRVPAVEPDRVTVNGKVVSINPGGNFNTDISIPGQGPLLIVNAVAKADQRSGAEKTVGIHGQGLDENEIVTQAMGINLTGSFMDILAETIVALVKDFPFQDILDAINPIIDMESVKFEITHITLADVGMTVKPVQAGLQIDTVIDDLSVGLLAQITILSIPITIEGSADVDQITYTALATSQQDGSGGAEVVMQNVDTQLIGFALHVENLADWLFTLVNIVVREAIEFIVDSLFNNVVPNAINSLLDAIHAETSLAGLGVVFDFETFTLDQGGLTAVFAANITPEQISKGINATDRSLYTPSDIPDFQGVTPLRREPYDLALILGDDLINRTLHSLTRAGTLSFEIESPMNLGQNLTVNLTAGSLAALFPSLGNVDPQLPVSMKIQPLAPPVVAPCGQLECSGLMFEAAFEMQVYLNTGSENTGIWEAFSVAFILKAEAGLALDDDNGIKISLAVPEIDVESVHNKINEEQVLLIKWGLEIVKSQLDTILERITTLSINVPEVLGIQLVPVEIGSGGDSGDFFTAYIRLETDRD